MTRVRLLEGLAAIGRLNLSDYLCYSAVGGGAILAVPLFGGLDRLWADSSPVAQVHILIYVIAPCLASEAKDQRRSKLTVISLRNLRNLAKCSRTALLHNGSLPSDKLPKTDSVSQSDCGANVRIEAARKANEEEHTIVGRFR